MIHMNIDPQSSAIQKENRFWYDDLDIPMQGDIQELDRDEEHFWREVIKAYLYPLGTKKEDIEKTQMGLEKLRDKAVFSFFIIDLLLMVLVLGFAKSGLFIEWTCSVGGDVKTSELDPIGFLFLIVFGGVLILQVIGMLLHRMFTFMQIMASTVICKGRKHAKVEKEMGMDVADLDQGGFSNDEVDINGQLILIFSIFHSLN